MPRVWEIEQMSTKPSKYIPGSYVFTLDNLYLRLSSGHWVYLRDKVLHPSILLNMPYGTVAGFIKAGMLRYALERGPSEENTN